MRGQLIAFVLDAQAVEVGVVGMLEHVGSEDSRNQDSVHPGWRILRRSFNPNGHVHGPIEGKTQQPMHEPHLALAC